jgi:YebC/PmpR family DNA-binding regulatory protein
MSKHSHWANIKRAKGSADRAKAIVGSKMLKVVASAAKQGGDPAMNFKLRIAMDTAKRAGVTKDAIERAVAKASGVGADAEQLEPLLYEAYGAGGVAILIDCLATNRNKVVAEIKHELAVGYGTLAASGAVQWMFNRKGVLRVPRPQDDAFELLAIDAGADDVVYEEEGYTIYTKPEDLEKVKDQIVSKRRNEKTQGNATISSPRDDENGNSSLRDELEFAGFQWIPKDRIPVPDEARAKLDELVEALENLEDVSEVFTNAE